MVSGVGSSFSGYERVAWTAGVWQALNSSTNWLGVSERTWDLFVAAEVLACSQWGLSSQSRRCRRVGLRAEQKGQESWH